MSGKVPGLSGADTPDRQTLSCLLINRTLDHFEKMMLEMLACSRHFAHPPRLFLMQ